MKKKLLTVFICAVTSGIAAALFVLFSNAYIINTQKSKIYQPEEISDIKGEYDCIIVLGAGVKPDGTPSDMLRDRLFTGIKAYNTSLAPKIIMSGDHGTISYDEVGTMKSFAIGKGVPSSDIFMDHAGFSSYDTIYRAKEIFGVRRAVIVTQEYHLYRTLYLAERLDIECVGVSADLNYYRGEAYREAREILARAKDFVSGAIKPKPKFLGEAIPVSGNGNITNDK